VNKKFVWILGAALLVAVGYGWLTQGSDPSSTKPEQIDFLSITTEIDDVREQITNKAKTAKSFKGAGVGVSNRLGASAKKVARVWVHEDGVILVQAKDFGVGHRDDVLFVLIPRFSAKDASVEWACLGYPREVVPSNCR
jgi:hypothetical protein